MSTSEAQYFHTEHTLEADAIRPNSILSEALLQNENVKVVRFHFAKGQELSEHTATVAAIMYQLCGRAEWGLGGDKRQAAPGDWVYMPPNLKHSIHAVEDSVVLLLLLKKTQAA